MKHLRKALSIFLCAVLVTGLFGIAPTPALADYDSMADEGLNGANGYCYYYDYSYDYDYDYDCDYDYDYTNDVPYQLGIPTPMSGTPGSLVDDGGENTEVVIGGVTFVRRVVQMPTGGGNVIDPTDNGMTIMGTFFPGAINLGFGRIRAVGLPGHGGWGETRPEHWTFTTDIILPAGAILESVRYIWNGVPVNGSVTFTCDNNPNAVIVSETIGSEAVFTGFRQATAWTLPSSNVRMIIHNEGPATYFQAYFREFTYLVPKIITGPGAGALVDSGPSGTVVYVSGVRHQRVVAPVPATGQPSVPFNGVTITGGADDGSDGNWAAGARAAIWLPDGSHPVSPAGGRINPNRTAAQGGEPPWTSPLPVPGSTHALRNYTITLPAGAILESVRYYWNNNTTVDTNSWIEFSSAGNTTARIESALGFGNNEGTAAGLLGNPRYIPRQATGWTVPSPTVTLTISNEGGGGVRQAYFLEFTYLIPYVPHTPTPVDPITVTLTDNILTTDPAAAATGNALMFAVVALTQAAAQDVIDLWDRGVTNIADTNFTFAALDGSPTFTFSQNGSRVIVVETEPGGYIVGAGVSAGTIDVERGPTVFPDDYEAIIINFGTHIPGGPGVNYAGINWNTYGGGWTRVTAGFAPDAPWIDLTGGARLRPSANPFGGTFVITLPEGAVFRSIMFYGNNVTTTATISSEGNPTVTFTRENNVFATDINDMRSYTNWTTQSSREVTITTNPANSVWNFYVWEISYYVPKGQMDFDWGNSMSLHIAPAGAITGDTVTRGGTLKYALVEGMPTAANSHVLRDVIIGWISGTTSEEDARDALRAIGQNNENLTFSDTRPVIGAGHQNMRLVVIEVDDDGYILAAGQSLAINFVAARVAPLTIAVNSHGIISGNVPTAAGTTLKYAFVDTAPTTVINAWLLGETDVDLAGTELGVTFDTAVPSISADEHNGRFLVVIEVDDLTGQVIAAGASAAIRMTQFGVTIGEQAAGGIGMTRTVTFVSEDSTVGKFMAVRIVEGSGLTHALLVPLNGATSTNISYASADSVITVWITNGMPNLTGGSLGVIVYGTATTAP